MESDALVSYADLLEAFEWVSSSAPMENSAFVSRKTGATHWASVLMELEDELPEDIEDGSIYVAVPHKRDLYLGKNLALNFMGEKLPESCDTVATFFRHRGAYGRFKDLLERKGMRKPAAGEDGEHRPVSRIRAAPQLLEKFLVRQDDHIADPAAARLHADTQIALQLFFFG